MTIFNYLSNSKNLKKEVMVRVKVVVVKKLIYNTAFTQDLKIASQRKHRTLMKTISNIGIILSTSLAIKYQIYLMEDVSCLPYLTETTS